MFNRAVSAEQEDDRKDVFGPVADMMVGVVFIFIILLIALSLNIVTEQGVPVSVHEKTVRERDQLAEFARFVRDSKVIPLMDRLSRADETIAKLLEDIRRRLEQQQIEVKVDPSNGTLQLPAGRLFNSGQAEPTPHGRETIVALGRVLADTLPCYAAAAQAPAGCPARPDLTALSAVYLEGHTDIDPINATTGTFHDNWDLSAARAIAAFKLIRDSNGTLRDLRNAEGEALLGVSGYADSRPAVHDGLERSTLEAKERDRRIEVRITMATNREAVGQILSQLNSRLDAIDALLH